MFIALAIDNVDNETSRTSSSHFYGMSISVFHHYDNLKEKENITCSFSEADCEKESSFELPLCCKDISPVSGVENQFPILTTNKYPKISQ